MDRMYSKIPKGVIKEFDTFDLIIKLKIIIICGELMWKDGTVLCIWAQNES
jgi:hypothetical protein